MSRLALLRTWAIDHDERRTFVWPYFCLSVAAGCFLSLFWLVLLIAVHFGMELYRQHASETEHAFSHAAWELKLDVSLFLVSIAISIYMDAAFGVLGLGRVGASVARVGGRIALVQKLIRPVLLSLDDVFRVLGMLVTARGIGRGLKDAARDVTEAPGPERPWARRWAWGDRIAIGIGVVSIVLLAVAPTASGHDLDGVLRIVVDELRPFRAD